MKTLQLQLNYQFIIHSTELPVNNKKLMEQAVGSRKRKPMHLTLNLKLEQLFY
jgi:hypothetical protein